MEDLRNRFREYGERGREIGLDLITRLYGFGGRLMGVGPDIMPYYQDAIREYPLLALMALGMDVVDLIPGASQIGAAGDAALLKMTADYVKREVGKYDPPRFLQLLVALSEGLSAFIPGLPAEVLPTALPLTMDAYRQVARHRYQQYEGI
ncbi:MAG: hypothetical protein QXY45_02395 [Candidatus Aenigmatarchaeota archaeon]